MFAALTLTVGAWLAPGSLLVTAFVYTLTACVGGTVTYHRLLSHRSFKAPRWFEVLGILIGVYGLFGTPLNWVAIHRQHHSHTDCPTDPHSPLYQPWWQVQWLSLLAKPNLRYTQDLISDKFLVWIQRNYLKIHSVIIISWISLKPSYLLYAYLWPSFLVWNFASMTNTVCHKFGYRNFETLDSSKNVWWLSILVFGEGWHNNHHAHPSRPSFSKKWWEIDLGALIIRCVAIGSEE